MQLKPPQRDDCTQKTTSFRPPCECAHVLTLLLQDAVDGNWLGRNYRVESEQHPTKIQRFYGESLKLQLNLVHTHKWDLTNLGLMLDTSQAS